MVDAGHNPAVVVSPVGRLNSPAIPKGVALGVVEDFEFTEGRFQLAPGATLMLYTDGATDARSTAEEIFGADRLMTAIRNADSAPAVLVSSVTAAIDAFATGAPQEDDITLLAIRRKA
jgi:sigma-B regulation protein RsbU (phosphoserine phosphatase)